jgi:uncharacterized protein involved in exopolysaccharide biosynthesis
MDELIRSLLMQTPAIAIVLYALNRVYVDWQADREQARLERAEMSKQIGDLSMAIAALRNSIEEHWRRDEKI